MVVFEDQIVRSLAVFAVLVGSACASGSGETAPMVDNATTPAAGAAAPAAASGGASAAGGAAGMSGVAAGSMAAAPLAGAPTFTAIYQEILTKGATGNCMFGACHGGEANVNSNGGLQIPAGDKATAYRHLVGVKSMSAVCMGKTYVVPHDSKNSMLISKLSATPACGARMPIGTPLTDAQMAQISAWIDMGAKDD